MNAQTFGKLGRVCTIVPTLINLSSMKNATYCGIDVSCESLDICYQSLDGSLKHEKITNDIAGFRRLLKLSGKSSQFVMEDTGVYHLSLVFFLRSHNRAFSVVNAMQIKRYIQMNLHRNKSDKKDARRICEFAMDRKPVPTNLPEVLYFQCKTLSHAIRKLTQQMTSLRNQLHSLAKSPVKNQVLVRSYKRLVRELGKQQEVLEMELHKKLAEWQPDLVKRVSSVKGIGKRASSELIVYTQGFRGMKSYRQLISYAGLSPLEYSSGSSIRGKARICKHGGKTIRHILYMCSLNASRTNSACKQLYERLVARGKNKKLALIAVCNKLLKQVFGVVRNQTMFCNDYLGYKA